MEPETPHQTVPRSRLPAIAESFADVADMKSRFTRGHSRRVAAVATGMAAQLGMPPDEIETIRVAGFTHDFGIATVPTTILEKDRRHLSRAEWEEFRLHPYHGERIVSRVPAWEAASLLVGRHHERIDGRGYHRELKGAEVPVGAQVIAAADTFDELTHEGPGSLAMTAPALLP